MRGSRKVKIPYPQEFVDSVLNEEDRLRALEGTLLTSEKIAFKCPVHGSYLMQVGSRIQRSTGILRRGCPKCALEKARENSRNTRAISRKYSDWLVESILSEEDRQRARTGELKSTDKIYFYCPEHGAYLKKVCSRISLKTGKELEGCPECAMKVRSGTLRDTLASKRQYSEEFIETLFNESDRIKARNGTLSPNDVVEFLCPEHGVYSTMVKSHFSLTEGVLKSGCPDCSQDKRINTWRNSLALVRKYPQWLIDELAHEEDKQRAREGTLLSTEDVDFICSKHGIYRQRVSNHICVSTGESRCGCPKCSQGNVSSGFERKVLEYLKSVRYLPYEKNRRGYLEHNYEVDIIFPSEHLMIECNGSLWHQTATRYTKTFVECRKDSNYHYDKFAIAKSKGYRLINLFDVDWEKPKVRKFLKDLVSVKKVIYARSCICKSITLTEAKMFCTDNHLQGRDSYSSVAYGLFLGDVLVSVMTFGSKRFSSSTSIWELCRYCVKRGITVVGGANKLLSEFEKNKSSQIKELISYSDNDFFTGDIYPSLGFSFKEVIRNYYWFYRENEVKREQAQISILKDKYPDLYQKSLSVEGNKEDFIMSSLGAYKVYRAGNTKWVKHY